MEFLSIRYNNNMDRGQATVEYLLVFAFVALIAVALLRSIGLAVGNGMGLLGTSLSRHLSVGVCQQDCYYNGFINQIE